MTNEQYESLKSVFNEVGEVNSRLAIVVNPFVKQILGLVSNSIAKGKVVEFVLNGGVNKRGEIKNRNKHWTEKAIINACNLSPLSGKVSSELGAHNLIEEIAIYRGHKYGFNEAESKKKKMTLLVDYLLSVSLCYVEVFGGSKVDKFYATRNINIANIISKSNDGNASKYTSYLRMESIDINNELIKVLKLTGRGNGYKITQPRSGIRVNEYLRITPVSITEIVWCKLKEVLTDNMVEFSYIKDNMTLRTMTSTLNRGILIDVYKDEGHVGMIMDGIGEQLSRGFVRVPELELSKYDETGVRALNITRLTDMKIVNKIDRSFVDVDFDCIMPTFISTCDSYGSNIQMLTEIYKGVFKKIPASNDCNEIRSELQTWARTQYSIGTTTFLKELHNFMLSMPIVFMGYNGQASTFGASGGGFNLGTV